MHNLQGTRQKVEGSILVKFKIQPITKFVAQRSSSSCEALTRCGCGNHEVFCLRSLPYSRWTMAFVKEHTYLTFRLPLGSSQQTTHFSGERDDHLVPLVRAFKRHTYLTSSLLLGLFPVFTGHLLNRTVTCGVCRRCL